MNNAILFFYNIHVSNINKINDNYYFKYLNENYGIYLFNRDINDAISIYNLNLELLQKGLIGYEIVLNKNKEVLFEYDNKLYILMKIPNIKNRIITFNDVLNFNYVVDSKYQKLDKSNWANIWSNKIDFIDNQFRQLENKYSIISDSIDYFTGIWENAITYFNENTNIKNIKVVSHKRVYTDMDLYSFLNPLNFVIDYKERDTGEYIKSYATNKNFSLNTFDNYIDKLDQNSLILLISRLLFPSYYFDIYEDIIIGTKKEKELNLILSKKDNVLKLLKYIFNKYEGYNIPYINWIKKED